VTEIVKASCIATVCYTHSRTQEIFRTAKSPLNQIPVRRHPDQFSEHTCKQKNTHSHFGREMPQRMVRGRIAIYQYAFSIPAQLFGLIQPVWVMLSVCCCVHELACQGIYRQLSSIGQQRTDAQSQKAQPIGRWQQERQPEYRMPRLICNGQKTRFSSRCRVPRI
jgi:hypothetical protein